MNELVTKEQKLKEIIDIRSFLSSNSLILLENLNVRRQASKNDSQDLFDFGSSEQDNVSSDIPWNLEYPRQTLLKILIQEKESLGLYVSGNPLESYRDFQIWVRRSLGKDGIYLLLINKIKKIFTKTNKLMLALDIATLDGDYEGIIFPKHALGLIQSLEPQELFWVKGNILDKRKPRKGKETNSGETQEYEDKPKIAVEKVAKFQDGVFSLLSEKDDISQQRKDILKSVNWSKIKESPRNYEDYLEEIIEVESVVKTVKVKLANTLGPEKMKAIKSILHKEKEPLDDTKISLEVQVGEVWKSVKGEFWINKAKMVEIYKS